MAEWIRQKSLRLSEIRDWRALSCGKDLPKCANTDASKFRHAG